MAAQARRGHEVTYLFSGRHYPGVRGPRVRRWTRGGVRMVEVVNPPIVVGLERGTRMPEHDTHEPRLERIFQRLVREVMPEIMHVQELLGQPSSVLELAKRAGVPVVMTLHDYFPLCATLRLLDADRRVCLRQDVGEDCATRNAEAPADAGQLARHTVHFELARAKERVPGLRRASFAPLRPLVDPLVERLTAAGLPTPSTPPTPAPPRPSAFQRRREINVERLRAVDRLMAGSHRVEEIYRTLGVDTPVLRTLHLALPHIERIAPRQPRGADRLTFATLGGFIGPSKGSDLMLEVLERLHAGGYAGAFTLRALGSVHPSARTRLGDFAEVERRGEYDRWELDALLADVDVGIMPSIWEEAYGLAGVELLAKGIPVVANRIGGMVDYVRDGETGWLNGDCSAEGLARILGMLIEQPREVADRSHGALAARPDVVKPFGPHVEEIEGVYREAVAHALGNLPAP